MSEEDKEKPPDDKIGTESEWRKLEEGKREKPSFPTNPPRNPQENGDEE